MGHGSTISVSSLWIHLGLDVKAQVCQVLLAASTERLGLLWCINLCKPNLYRLVITASGKRVTVSNADDQADEKCRQRLWLLRSEWQRLDLWQSSPLDVGLSLYPHLGGLSRVNVLHHGHLG
jgi:hypothetical protein